MEQSLKVDSKGLCGWYVPKGFDAERMKSAFIENSILRPWWPNPR